MSYCRFSTDDFQSDIYCYADCHGGFTIHLAANRVVFKEPLPNPVAFEPGNFEPWYARYQTIMRMVDEAERVEITLPYAGDMLHEETLEDTYKRLLELREIGYRVPEQALEFLKYEMEEENAGGNERT